MSAQSEWPIVIYGAARSGTTYLVQILNQHPDVYVTDEAWVFAWADEALRQLGDEDRTTPRDHDEPGGTRIGDRRAFIEHARQSLGPTIRDFYRRLAPAARWWGDKHPHYADPSYLTLLDSIRQLFPATRFVHLIRDGRDVVTSGLRGVWTDFVEVHEMWTTHLDLGAAFGRGLPAGQYFELRYEDLVDDDVTMARRLFAFLGVEWHEAVESFCRAQRERRTPYCTPTRDIARDVAGSDWATYLTAEEQLRSLELLGRHLLRYGYATPRSLAADRRRAAESAHPNAPLLVPIYR
jgi:sulfotransferase family protein